MTASLSLLRPGVFKDPYATYHHLRAEDPVRWEFLLGAWLVTRYDDVAAALRDPRCGATPAADGLLSLLPEWLRAELHPLARALSAELLLNNPPAHTRLRTAMHRAFTPHLIERLRPAVQRIADQLIDAGLRIGRMDVMRDLAGPLPLAVLCELLGIPEQDRDRFIDWSDSISAFISGGAAGEAFHERARSAAEAERAMRAYVAGLCQKRRAHPGDDLLSALASGDAGERLTEDEILGNCLMLLRAGHRNVANLIGNGMLALLRHQDQLRLLRHDPSLIENAVEEVLRYDSPVHLAVRRTTGPISLGGRRIGVGQTLYLMLGAANRDPARFPNPDTFDISRSGARHLALGHGIHYCLGAALARLEAAIMITTLLRRVPAIRLAGGFVEEREPTTLRGLMALPVEFEASLCGVERARCLLSTVPACRRTKDDEHILDPLAGHCIRPGRSHTAKAATMTPAAIAGVRTSVLMTRS
jgi:cytochrome P450